LVLTIEAAGLDTAGRSCRHGRCVLSAGSRPVFPVIGSREDTLPVVSFTHRLVIPQSSRRYVGPPLSRTANRAILNRYFLLPLCYQTIGEQGVLGERNVISFHRFSVGLSRPRSAQVGPRYSSQSAGHRFDPGTLHQTSLAWPNAAPAFPARGSETPLTLSTTHPRLRSAT